MLWRWVRGLYRVLADKKVHYLGEPIALVAAETEGLQRGLWKRSKLNMNLFKGL